MATCKTMGGRSHLAQYIQSWYLDTHHRPLLTTPSIPNYQLFWFFQIYRFCYASKHHDIYLMHSENYTPRKIKTINNLKVVRLCSAHKVQTHQVAWHAYLSPVVYIVRSSSQQLHASNCSPSAACWYCVQFVQTDGSYY